MQQQSELPEGWAECQIKDIITINYGKGLKKSDRIEGQFDVFGSNGIVGKHNKSFTKGPTIIIGRKGSVGEINLSSESCWPIDTTYYIDNFYEINLFFLYNLLKTLNLANYDTSTAIPGINRNDIYSLVVSLPPLAEQHRIVSAIEALFARLDAANKRLDRVPEILKKFRQSVLAAACDGRLTEGWREENEFADSWKTTTIGDISDLTSGLHFKKSEYSEEGIRLLQITNVSFGVIKWEKTAFLPDNYAINYPELVLKPGDLLMALNRPLLGDKLKVSKLTESDCPSILYQRVGRFDIYNEEYKDYFYCFLQSPLFIERLRKNLQGVDQPFINKSKLLKMQIPLPPLSEQHEIVRRVDALFALADSIGAKVAAARERTEKMRQSILAKAFSGELVPTEAELARTEGRDYEPADVLLERIKAKRGK